MERKKLSNQDIACLRAIGMLPGFFSGTIASIGLKLDEKFGDAIDNYMSTQDYQNVLPHKEGIQYSIYKTDAHKIGVDDFAKNMANFHDGVAIFGLLMPVILLTYLGSKIPQWIYAKK